jgi:hypothetical protein
MFILEQTRNAVKGLLTRAEGQEKKLGITIIWFRNPPWLVEIEPLPGA